MYLSGRRPGGMVPRSLGDDGSSTSLVSPGTTSTYDGWVSAVRAAGGSAVVLPGTSTPAAKYPASTWVPLVNALTWPQPDAYSSDGQWGYYTAPPLVVQYVAANMLTTPTSPEIATGAGLVQSQWLHELFAAAAPIGKVLAGGAVLYLLFRFASARASQGRR